MLLKLYALDTSQMVCYGMFMAREPCTRCQENERAVRGLWCTEFRRKLLALHDDWDGLGASSIDSNAVFALMSVLFTASHYAQSEPDIVPSPEGGVSAEWRDDSRSFAVHAEPDGSARYHYANRLTRFESDGQISSELSDEAKRWLWSTSAKLR